MPTGLYNAGVFTALNADQAALGMLEVITSGATLYTASTSPSCKIPLQYGWVIETSAMRLWASNTQIPTSLIEPDVTPQPTATDPVTWPAADLGYMDSLTRPLEADPLVPASLVAGGVLLSLLFGGNK